MVVLAHAADAGGLPFSRGLMAYLLVAVVCLTLWGERVRTIQHLAAGRDPRPARARRPRRSAAADPLPQPGAPRPAATVAGGEALARPLARGPLLAATRALGLVGFAVLLVVALFGSNDGGLNPATLLVVSVGYVAVPVLCLVIGDGWTPFDPFVTIAAVAALVATGRRGAGGEASGLPAWLPAAGLFGFLLVTSAGPDNFPPPTIASGKATAAALAALAVWAAVLGASNGAEAARAALPLSRLAATIGDGGVLYRRDDGRLAARPPLNGLLAPPAGRPGTSALVSVWLGGVLFASLTLTNWWARVLSDRTTVTRQLLAVIGLVWAIALVAGVHQGAMWLLARLGEKRAAAATGGPPLPSAAELNDRFAATLVPLGVAWLAAHFLGGWLVDLQFVRVFASDPLAGGHDFFGTISDPVNYAPLVASTLGWIESAMLLAGAAGSAYAAHRMAVSLLPPRQALSAALPVALELGAAVTVAMYVLVG